MSDYFLYVKTTNRCQLQCAHCYVNSDNTKTLEINYDAVELYINDFCIKHSNDRIIASLHGGEPLLANVDKIYNLVKNTKHDNIYWSATTNLIYDIDESKEKLFNQFIQPDGTKLILTSYDLMIRFKNNQEELWKENVKKLVSKGFIIKPIVCLTKYMTKKNIKDLFDMFIDIGIVTMNFERITETGRSIQNQLRYSNKDLDNLLYEVYCLWDNQYRDKISITIFEDIELAVKKGILVGCRARHCMENVITINPDGSIAGCPNQFNKTYKDIKGNNLKYSKEELICQEMKINPKCYICEYFKYCNGDCFQLIWDETGCPGMKSLISYILNN